MVRVVEGVCGDGHQMIPANQEHCERVDIAGVSFRKQTHSLKYKGTDSLWRGHHEPEKDVLRFLERGCPREATYRSTSVSFVRRTKFRQVVGERNQTRAVCKTRVEKRETQRF